MGFNLAGAAAGYQGYKDEERRSADDALRAKADIRADQDAAYQEEARGRQRKDWSEADRIKAADKADRDAIALDSAARGKVAEAADEQGAAEAAVASDRINAAAHEAVFNGDMPKDMLPAPAAPSFKKAPLFKAAAGAVAPRATALASGADQYAAATPGEQATGDVQVAPAKTSPKLDPAVAAKVREMRAGAGGVPQPRNFNDALASQAEFVRRKMARGDMTTEDWAKQTATLNMMESEGVNRALNAFAAGDYEGGIAAFNQVGKRNGARVVKGEAGVTKLDGPDGPDSPTHFVTIANADGSRTVMDVAKARYQLLDLDKQLGHQDKAARRVLTARELDDKRDHNAAELKIRQQAADTNSAWRADLARAKGQEAGQAAPIWNKENNTFLQEQYQSKDEMTGAKTYDGGGFIFAKEVALARSRSNGGDADSAIAEALVADNALKQRAGGDAAKLRQLRAAALRTLQSRPAPGPARAGGTTNAAEWNARNEENRAGAPDRAAAQRAILEQELAAAKNPADIAALEREIARLGPNQRQVATVPNPVAADAKPGAAATGRAPGTVLKTPGGIPAAAPTYEGWVNAKNKLEAVKSTAANMSANQRDIYLAQRVPELEASVKFHAAYPKY